MRTLFFILMAVTAASAQTGERLVDLRGQWLFQIGDRNEWKDPEFDDSQWGSIFVPAPWEDEGYPGYDGYAWYRIHVVFPADIPEGDLYLELGRIDDADQTYVNGTLVGASGQMPPFHKTAYHLFRNYRIPREIIRPGVNVIAVRVYDDRLLGGMLEGKPGVYLSREHARVMDLSGYWHFNTGDRQTWKFPGYDHSDWATVPVPSKWEEAGFEDLDGFAWYRLQFTPTARQTEEARYLILGKIDDADEVWINGTFVGYTGSMDSEVYTNSDVSEWQTYRIYGIPPGLLKPDEPNLIAVRVLDVYIDGGIFEGPVGLYRQVPEYIIRHNQETQPSNLEIFFRWLFNW